MERHTVFHDVPSWRAIPRTEACSRRICSMAHQQARTVNSPRGRATRSSCSTNVPVGPFLEQDETIAAPRSKLTVRAARWAVEQIRREHASVNGIRRQLGCGWRTVWDTIRPILQAAADDPARFEGVTRLGVDEHIVRHEALLFRMEVRDRHRLAVAAAG